MNVDKSSGYRLLPDVVPPEDAIGPARYDPRLVEDLRSYRSEEQIRAVLWTLALAEEFARIDIARRIPGFRFATAGFTDPEHERDDFGIIVYSHPNPSITAGARIASIVVGEREFPIYLRSVIEVLHHAILPHPTGMTSACRARSARAGVVSTDGVLTCKHGLVVHNPPPTIGDQVEMRLGQTTLLDLGMDGIDAALLADPHGIQGAPLKTRKYIAQFTDVIIDGAATGAWKTKITEVILFNGNYMPALPMRVFFAQPGVDGDSGALIVDDQDFGLGLYMGGDVNTGTNHMHGFGQHLEQVCHLMQLDVYL